MSEDSAPFIPPRADARAMPKGPWRVFATRAYFRLWLAQVISSTGDWIGLIAIVAIAARVSDNSGTAVSLVMLARVVPGFFLGTVGGVIIDRFDRRRVMVACDVGRASMFVLLPFVDTVAGLVLISFVLEMLTLLWGPAKDASVPHLVAKEQLTAVNSLSLVASYATFPVASLVFSLLAAVDIDQEALALYVDAATFLVSAFIVWRLPIPHETRHRGRRVDWTSTLRDIKEGLGFIAGHPRVRGVVVGLGVGLIGCGAMVPLGPAFARQVLGGGSATFGALMTAFGVGASIGVIVLLLVQRKLRREAVFDYAVMAAGAVLILAASFSNVAVATLLIAAVGACAGTSYVTGFTVLQETVHDELRGRTFATLYTVIRLCLLLALVVSPLWADLWDWAVGEIFGGKTVSIGDQRYRLTGVRVALWGGGLITLAAGWWARWTMVRARRLGPNEHGLGVPEPGAA